MILPTKPLGALIVQSTSDGENGWKSCYSYKRSIYICTVNMLHNIADLLGISREAFMYAVHVFNPEKRFYRPLRNRNLDVLLSKPQFWTLPPGKGFGEIGLGYSIHEGDYLRKESMVVLQRAEEYQVSPEEIVEAFKTGNHVSNNKHVNDSTIADGDFP